MQEQIKQFRPMKACDVDDFSQVPLPCYVSIKYDGIRCLKYQGKVLTQTLKPLPNDYTRIYLEKYLPEGWDGELCLCDPKATFNDVQSAFMSVDGEPDFIFRAFDDHRRNDEPYNDRLYSMWLEDVRNLRVEIIEQIQVNSRYDLEFFSNQILNAGHEGVMFRARKSFYKYGLSTLKEGALLRYKPTATDEAVIIGFEEQMQNNNEKVIDARGLSKRSSKKEGLVGKGTMGKFVVQYKEHTFSIGTGVGLTEKLRKEIWDNQEQYLGKTITFKFQKHGTKLKPRQPIFLGFRYDAD